MSNKIVTETLNRRKLVSYFLNVLLIFFAIGSLTIIITLFLGQSNTEFIFENWNPYLGINIYLAIWIICIYGVMLSYGLSVLNYIGVFFSRSSFWKKLRWLYSLSSIGHSIVFFVTFPILIYILFVFVYSYTRYAFIGSLIALPLGIFFIGFLYYGVGKVVFIYDRKYNLLRLTASILAFIVMIALCFVCIAVVMEVSPRYWGVFNLQDKEGTYIINYDGDYWLTYFVESKECSAVDMCVHKLNKVGNTAIIEAPDDLKKYLDKPVRIDGEFVKIVGPFGYNDYTEEYRAFCILSNGKKQCRPGKGTGVWHYSPLRIKSIEVVVD